MSFRTRLMLTSLTSLVVGLGVLLVAGNLLLDRRVESETSSLLRAHAETQIAALTIGGDGVRVRETANDSVLDKQAWVFSGDRVLERPAGVSPALDAAAAALRREPSAREAGGPGGFRLRAQPVLASGRGQVATVVVAQSTDPFTDLQEEVLVGSLVFAALALLAGGFAVRHGVRGALQPVVEMTSAADDWGAHDLEHRFALGPARDELTSLAATLDGLLARIAASRRHEQRFAGDVAHELRTPLAGLRARAELALGESAGEGEREAALRAVVEQTERLAGTVDALMAVARQDLGREGTSVDPEALVRELEGVEVSVHGVVPHAEGDADIARRALAPLVDNARRHARSRVVVELSADESDVTIRVRDDGPGVPADALDHVFEPGFQGQGGGGAGLGLPLARRLARACGGDVTAGAGPGGCFVLSLPRADN